MNKTIVFAAALIVGTSPLAAQSVRRVASPAPIIVPAPVFSWSGLYGGVNVGYGFGADSNGFVQQQQYYNLNSLDAQGIGYGGPAFRNSSNLSGVIGGGQIGFNFQVAPWAVFGIEADIQGANLRSSSGDSQLITQQFFPNPLANSFFPLLGSYRTTQSVDWFGTVRGRVGFVPFSQNVLVYATGGLAYGSVRQNFGYNAFYLPSDALGFVGAAAGGANYANSTRAGYTIGAGVEWAPTFSPNWSFKIEYLYTDLSSRNLSAIGSGSRLDGQGGRVVSATSTSPARFNTVRAGVNYRFNFGQTPFVATY